VYYLAKAENAVINTRFITYGSKKCEPEAKAVEVAENIVINTRFITYGIEKRDY